MFFKSTILSIDNLNIAKAIPIKDIEKALNIYKANNNNSILATKNNLGHYLAGLLSPPNPVNVLLTPTLRRIKPSFASHNNIYYNS